MDLKCTNSLICRFFFNALQLVTSMDVELQIRRLTVNVQVDFRLYRRKDALTPLWLKGQSMLYSVLVAQSCLSLCDPMDCSLPSSSVRGILQARILEWVAIFLLQGIFQSQGSNSSLLSLLCWRADSLPLAPPGKVLYQY